MSCVHEKPSSNKKAIGVLVMEFFSNFIKIAIKFFYIYRNRALAVLRVPCCGSKTSKNSVLIYNNTSQKLKKNQVMTFITTNSLTKTTSSSRGLKITGTGSSLILILSLKIKQTKANYFLILK